MERHGAVRGGAPVLLKTLGAAFILLAVLLVYTGVADDIADTVSSSRTASSSSSKGPSSLGDALPGAAGTASTGWQERLSKMVPPDVSPPAGLEDGPGYAATFAMGNLASSPSPEAPIPTTRKPGPGHGQKAFTAPTWERLIFVTSHGGNAHADRSNNIQVFDYELSGAHLHHWHLRGYAIAKKDVHALGLQNLRGMAAAGDGALFVASAHSSRSKIVLTRRCTRTPRVAKTFAVDGLAHPYGLAFRGGRLFATNQQADSVVRFDVGDGVDAKAHHFAQVKSPRGLAFDADGFLWVCSTKDGVHVFDGAGRRVKRIRVKHAVGIAFDAKNDVMVVGSVDGHKKSAVVLVSAKTRKVGMRLRPPPPFKLSHPAGLVITDDRLIVIAQDQRVLYAWDTVDYSFKGPILQDLPDRPEQIAIMQCSH